MTTGLEKAMVQNIAESKGWAPFLNNSNNHIHVLESMAAIAWFCFVLFFLLKPLTLKDEGAGALSPLHWGPQ